MSYQSYIKSLLGAGANPIDIIGAPLQSWITANMTSVNRDTGSGAGGIASWTDGTEEFAETLQYASDFSVDTDGWTGQTRCTVARVASFQGESDVFEVTMSGGGGTHATIKNIGTPNFTVRNITFKMYIPSGQTIQGMEWQDNTAARWRVEDATKDVWTTYNTGRTTGNSTSIRFQPRDATDTTFNADGDVFYIKDVVVNSVDGEHFIETSGSAQPIWDGINKVTFDGTNDESASLNTTAVLGDQQGFLIIVGKANGASDEVFFSGYDAATYLTPVIKSTGELGFLGSAAVPVDSTGTTSGSLQIFMWGSDGTNTKYKIGDAATESFASGEWFGDYTTTSGDVFLGQLGDDVDYGSVDIHELVYADTYDQTNVDDMFNYFKNKYMLY